MDPELKGPDPVWACIRKGKGHVYYALLAVTVAGFFVNPRWAGGIVSVLAWGVLVDCWAHQYLH